MESSRYFIIYFVLSLEKTQFSQLSVILVIKRESSSNSVGEKKGKGYWAEITNRRAFFCEFAAEKSFDPLIADNWNSVTKRQVVAKKVHIDHTLSL